MEWVRSTQEWQLFLPKIVTEPVLAVALQTSGPDPLCDHITHIALATGTQNAIVDVGQLGGPRALQTLIGPLLSGSDRVKAFYNAKTALRFLLPLNIVPARIFDSMLAEQLLAAGEMTLEPTIEELVHARLHSDLHTLAPADHPSVLANAVAVYRLRQELVPLLVKANLVRCAHIEFECTVPTAAMEHAGLRLDVARLQALIAQGIHQMEICTRSFVQGFDDSQNDLFGNAILNLHSDGQVLQFLQEHGVPVNRVNRSTLKPLVKRYPALQYLLDYRQAANDKSLESYIQAVHPVSGRIHATYSQLAAATGRFGCSNPNMQSFPRSPQHRACVVPAPGKSLIIADYSQIELRIVAQMSRDRRMLEAFRHHGDLHTLTASILTDKQPKDVTRAERQAAKAVNFGLIYSMGARGLAMYAEQTYGVEMTLAQAEHFRTRYFSAYTGVQAWHAQVRRDKPTSVRTLSGRLRHVPEGLLSQALNSPVQGTGADILKSALVKLYPALRPLGGQIVGVVHDEVLVEVPQTQAEAATAIVNREMEAAACEFLPDVPCPVEATVATSWAEKG